MFDKNFFFTPLFSTCFGIRDPGWVKIRIRDKHPGSATLDPVDPDKDPDPQHGLSHRLLADFVQQFKARRL
jgi:hypothetical protein